jgi:Sulfotransferase family
VIISHQHRFVFVKTRKTAGTSIEVFLSQIAGADAVVTPLLPEVPGHVARNYEKLDNPLRAAVLRARQRQLPGGRDRHPAYFNHIPARSIRKRLGRRRFDSYFTFCFERNPWEKAVSRYYFAHGRGEFDGSFREFVLQRGHLESDFGLYSFDGETVGVDFVGRYERLEEDLGSVVSRLGLDHDFSLTREKGNYRPRDATVDALFDDEMSLRIEQFYAREIRAFGYTRPEQLAAPLVEDSSDGPAA